MGNRNDQGNMNPDKMNEDRGSEQSRRPVGDSGFGSSKGRSGSMGESGIDKNKDRSSNLDEGVEQSRHGDSGSQE